MRRRLLVLLVPVAVAELEFGEAGIRTGQHVFGPLDLLGDPRPVLERGGEYQRFFGSEESCVIAV